MPDPQARRHGIPPAPLPRDNLDLFTDGESELLLTLWQSLRNVLTWAAIPVQWRTKVFGVANQEIRERLAEARAEVPELAVALHALESLRCDPDTADPGTVARACHAVHRWAERRSLLSVAVHFAEAAAYAQPDVPTWAVDAAWACRQAGATMMERSGVWYQRALKLAVRAESRKEAMRARRRRTPARRGGPHRAPPAGRRRAALPVRARRRSGERGRSRGTGGARPKAVRGVDRQVPHLAHDFAVLLTRAGYYRTALRMLDRILPMFDRPDELALVFGTAARAAGGCRRMERFAHAERAALDLLALYELHAAGTLVQLAEGAFLMNDADRVRRYATEAVERARTRGDMEAGRMALRLLDALERGERPAPESIPDYDSRIAALARRFAARLRRWRRRDPSSRVTPG